MKSSLMVVALCFSLLVPCLASAQETKSEGVSGWANEWKYAFSKAGVKEWKPEFTLRYQTGLWTSGPVLSGGVRVDEKRTFGLMLGHGDTYIDAAPADLYSINAALMFRRYWHLGAQKRFAIYGDFYAGCGWIYKINGEYNEDNVGDPRLILGIQPGVRVRCYKNLHVFLGPTIATDYIGLHVGIGF